MMTRFTLYGSPHSLPTYPALSYVVAAAVINFRVIWMKQPLRAPVPAALWRSCAATA